MSADWRSIGQSFPTLELTTYDKKESTDFIESTSKEKRHKKSKKSHKTIETNTQNILSITLNTNDNSDLYQIDRYGDKDMLLYENSYRLDVPLYEVIIRGQSKISSNKLHTTHLLIPTTSLYTQSSSSTSTNTINTIFHSLPSQKSIQTQLRERDIRYAKSTRFFSKHNRYKIESPDLIRLNYSSLLKAKKDAKLIKESDKTSVVPSSAAGSSISSSIWASESVHITTSSDPTTPSPAILQLKGYGNIIRYDLPTPDSQSSLIPSTRMNDSDKAGSTQFLLPFTSGLNDDIEAEKTIYDQSLYLQSTSQPTSLLKSPYLSETDRMQYKLAHINKTYQTLASDLSRRPLISTYLELIHLQYTLYTTQHVCIHSYDMIRALYSPDLLEQHCNILSEGIKALLQAASESSHTNLLASESIHRQAMMLSLLYIHKLSNYKSTDVIDTAWVSVRSDLPLSIDIYYEYLLYTRQISTQPVSTVLQVYITHYNDLSKTLKNKESARRFSTMIIQDMTAMPKPFILNNGKGHNSDLPTNLQYDSDCILIDMYIDNAMLHVSAGYNERSVALIQSLLELALFTNTPTDTDTYANKGSASSGSSDEERLALFLQYWESEYPRLGESHIHAQSSDTSIGGTSSNGRDQGLGRGMSAWVRAGSPQAVTCISDATAVEASPEAIVDLWESLYPLPDTPNADSSENVDIMLYPAAKHLPYSASDPGPDPASTGAVYDQNLSSWYHKRPYSEDNTDEVEAYDSSGSDEEDKLKVKKTKKEKQEKKSKKHKRHKHDDKPPLLPPQPPPPPSLPPPPNTAAELVSAPLPTLDLEAKDDKEAEYKLVYSRVHGYKIRIRVGDRDSETYKKILSELSGHDHVRD